MRRKVLVIGAGLAGTLIANNLAGKHDVTVLEVGRSDGYEYSKVKYLRKEFGNVRTFCHGEGGTTNLWHNGLMPMRQADMGNDRFREILGEAAAFSDEAAESLFFPTPHFSSDHQSLVRRMGELNDRLGLFAEGVDCLLYPKSYRALRMEQGVHKYFRVKDIEFKARGGRIERVEFSAGLERKNTNPDTVVISAGALGTPFLVSKVLSSLGCSSLGAGRGLMDHPMGFVGKIKVARDLAGAFRDLSLLDRDSYVCCTAGRLKCSGHLAAIYLRPALTMKNDLALHKYKSLLGASRKGRRIRAAVSPKLFHPDVLAEIYSHLFHAPIKSNIFSILVFFEQKRGTACVTEDGDGHVVDWEIGRQELDIYNRMLKQLHSALAPMAEDLVIETPIDESWLWSGAHHSGTISLGDEEDDIVDSELRVKKASNVYVCDASIIQEHSYANTGLTIGQLAHRLAATIG